jgi:lactoylglutathione lyase
MYETTGSIPDDLRGTMPERAFPVIYAQDVERSVRFYQRLGFQPHVRLPSDGEAGYVGLRRGSYELAIVTTQSPEQLIGVEVGSGPCFELFVYVDDVDKVVGQLQGDDGRVLKEPEDMFWGERVAYVADPDGNPVALAVAAGSA